MSTSFRQREIAADALRAGRTQVEAALAAGIGLSTLKRWLRNDSAFLRKCPRNKHLELESK